MLITSDQILCHLVGDYLIQSHWMASEKTKRSVAAAAHAFSYTLPFLFVTQSPMALFLITVSHFVIDRWRLARFVVWAKNGMRGEVTATGYSADVPAWLAVWLFIIADNTLHLFCNGAAIWISH